jgi:HEAT repeat protein
VGHSNPFGRWRGVVAAGALGLFGLGCAGTWDTLSSRRFREKPFETIFYSQDPMYVLKHVPDGDERIRAMRAIEEPKANGGTDQEQEEVLQILTASANSDPQAMCRLAAIDALARFQDPRIPQALVSAYQNAESEEPAAVAASDDGNGVETVGLRRRSRGPGPSFAPEMVTAIRCKSVETLGTVRSPAALALLCDVATTPPKKKDPKAPTDPLNPFAGEVNHAEVRIAAVRALGNYQGERQAVEALLRVLQNEKDVVLRSRAHEALVNATGQRLPPEAEQWQAWLEGKATAPQPAGPLERVGINLP